MWRSTETDIGKTRVFPHIEGYEFNSFLYTGGFADVYGGKSLDRGEDVAMKMAMGYHDNCKMSDLLAVMQHEIDIMERLNHDRIVKVKDYFINTWMRPCYVMPLIDGHNLSQIKTMCNPDNINNGFVAYFLGEMLELLTHMHERRIVHRDISLSNIILNRDGHYHLIDFGCAVDMDNASPIRFKCFNPLFSAPEILDGDDTPEPAFDIYSVGAICRYILNELHVSLTGKSLEGNFLSSNEKLLSIIDQRLLISIEKALTGSWSSAAEWYKGIEDFIITARDTNCPDIKDFAARYTMTYISNSKFNTGDTTTVTLTSATKAYHPEPPTDVYGVFTTNPVLVRVICTWRAVKAWWKSAR